MATGYSMENNPAFPGSEYTVKYGDISTNPDDYEGKSVLILGTSLYCFFFWNYVGMRGKILGKYKNWRPIAIN